MTSHFWVGLGLRVAVFSLACLSGLRSFYLSSSKVLFHVQGACADSWFSCVAAATLLTPCHFHWACFSFRGFICACAFYLAVFLSTLVTFKIICILVYSVLCRVGADMSAVSSVSFPPMCVCSLPGYRLLCLALVDAWHTTVDCLFPALSAAMLWACDVDFSPLVMHPPFAWQQGPLTYILSWAFQLALVGLRYLRVPQSSLAGWLLRPDIVCSMSHGSGLSSPGLICCYAMSPWCLTYSPWLYALRLFGNRVR